MKRADNLTMENDFFASQESGSLLVVKERKHFSCLTDDLAKINAFYEFFDAVARHSGIKVLVSFGVPGKRGFAESAEFICNVLSSRKDAHLMQRFFNVVNHYVSVLSSMNKVTVHADSGKVSLFHLNLSLAYDYRIVADDTVFENAYARIGLVAKGGGGYFLSRMLGVKKAAEVMLWSSFSAEEALSLGLVDRIVPAADLERETLALAANFGRPVAAMLGIRKLLKSDPRELERSLQLEDSLIFARLNDPEFRKDFEDYCREQCIAADGD